MTTVEITIDDEKIQELLHRDRGMAAFLEPILNQILQAEMTEHLGAGNLRFPAPENGPTIGKATATGVASGSSPRGSAGLSWRCRTIETGRSRPNSPSAISGRDGRLRLPRPVSSTCWTA